MPFLPPNEQRQSTEGPKEPYITLGPNLSGEKGYLYLWTAYMGMPILADILNVLSVIRKVAAAMRPLVATISVAWCRLQWNVIGGSVMCCGCRRGNDDDDAMALSSANETWSLGPDGVAEASVSFVAARDHHHRGTTVPLSSHSPLYLPGNIIHVVRNHPHRAEYVYLALLRILACSAH